MTADTYYMLWCIGLIVLAVIGLPLAYWRGLIDGRRDGYASGRRAGDRACDSRVANALIRQREQLLGASERGRWNETEAYRQARITTHELAAKLLALPEIPVVLAHQIDPTEMHEGCLDGVSELTEIDAYEVRSGWNPFGDYESERVLLLQ